MKSLLLAAVVASATLTAPLCLAQQKAPAPDASSATKPVEPKTAEFDKQMAQVQDNMKKMQEHMDKISVRKIHRSASGYCRNTGRPCRIRWE